jgi:hypothetical protein
MAISGEVKSLTENIEASYETRVVEELAQTVTEFLAVAERERKQEFTILLQEIKSQVADIQNDAANSLADFRSNHRQMAEALRGELADFRSQQKEMVAALRSEFATFSRDLHQQVSGMLAEFSSDQQQARAEWEKLTRVMSAKRAGKQASSVTAKKDTPTSV